jgi:hypothetical protein
VKTITAEMSRAHFERVGRFFGEDRDAPDYCCDDDPDLGYLELLDAEMAQRDLEDAVGGAPC